MKEKTRTLIALTAMFVDGMMIGVCVAKIFILAGI